MSEAFLAESKLIEKEIAASKKQKRKKPPKASNKNKSKSAFKKSKAKANAKSLKQQIKKSKSKGLNSKERKTKAFQLAQILTLPYRDTFGLDATSGTTKRKIELYQQLLDAGLGFGYYDLAKKIASVQALVWKSKKFRLHLILDTKEKLSLFYSVLHLATTKLDIKEESELDCNLPQPPWHQNSDQTSSPNSPILHYASMISGDWGIAFEDLESQNQDNKEDNFFEFDKDSKNNENITYLAWLQERKEINDYLGRAQTDVVIQRNKLIKLSQLAPTGEVQFLLELAPVNFRGTSTSSGGRTTKGWSRIIGFEHNISIRDSNVITVKKSVSPLDSIYCFLDMITKLHKNGESNFYALRSKYQQQRFQSFLPWFLSTAAKTNLESDNWPQCIQSELLIDLTEGKQGKLETQDNVINPNTNHNNKKSWTLAQSSKEFAWKPEKQISNINKATEIFLKQIFGSKSKFGEGGTYGFANRFPNGWASFAKFLSEKFEKSLALKKAPEETKQEIIEEIANIQKLTLISEEKATDLIINGKDEEVLIKTKGTQKIFYHKGKCIGKAQAETFLDFWFSVDF
jgi:hypothetical protein